jgi:hypothetical protein
VSGAKRFESLVLRRRYPLLVAWSAVWFLARLLTEPARSRGGDWPWFEFGARTLIHLNSHYATGALSLYAHNPEVQIGPPPLIAVAAFQWLPPAAVRLLFAVLVTLAGAWCLRCVELIVGREATGERWLDVQRLVARAGVLVVPIWAWESVRWEHLDDVMAITAAMTAMAVIASGRRWWLAALLVGIAVASKPWALAIAPCLLALPREERSRATLVAILTAGLCWAPFVVGAPQTVNALGGYQVVVDPGSTLHLLGVPLVDAPRWVRPLQLVGGFLLAVVVVRRRQWLALPVVVFGFRVLVDPQTWGYYGLGPLVGAVLWDCANARRWPSWTVATAAVEFLVPAVAPGWAAAARLVWFLAVMVSVLRATRTDTGRLGVGAPGARPEPALV